MENRDIELVDIESFIQANDDLSDYLSELHQGNSRKVAIRRKWRVDDEDDEKSREDKDDRMMQAHRERDLVNVH